MSISFVGSNISLGTTVNFPAHQAGDFIFLIALNRGTTGLGPFPYDVNLPWVSINSSALQGIASVACTYRVAQSSSETSGTWTGATALMCAIYRHSTKLILSTRRQGTLTNSATIAYQSWSSYINSTTAKFTTASAWAVTFLISQNQEFDIFTPQTGFVLRQSLTDAVAGSFGIFDTNGYVSSVNAQNIILSFQSPRHLICFELYDGPDKSSSSSSASAIRSPFAQDVI